MGCCESAITEQQRQAITNELKICIQSKSISRLGSLCKSFTKGSLRIYTINTFRFKSLKGKHLNMPAYCLLLNNLEVFKYLHTTFKIDFSLMESILREYDISGIGEICANNYMEFLEYYLPFYLSIDLERASVFSNVTLDLQDRDNSKYKISYSAVQLACMNGYISILNYIYNYFRGLTPPVALDIHHTDYTTGENCALLACRPGNYPMIRFLHLVCNADFKVLNNKNESAIQILASSGKQKYAPDLCNSLMYLVEKIGVDVMYGYEETLLILESSECIVYIEQQLALRQVYASKVEIEYNNRLIKRNSEDAHREVNVEKNSLASPIEPIALHFSSLSDVVSMFTNK